MKIFQKFLLIPSWYIFGEFLVRFSEFLPFDPYRGGGLANPQIGIGQYFCSLVLFKENELSVY